MSTLRSEEELQALMSIEIWPQISPPPDLLRQSLHEGVHLPKWADYRDASAEGRMPTGTDLMGRAVEEIRSPYARKCQQLAMPIPEYRKAVA